MGHQHTACIHRVHCRIGSLEMFFQPLFQEVMVHCRIGSLEIYLKRCGQCAVVHCRIGSLENGPLEAVVRQSVHCRIGSLENIRFRSAYGSDSSLPHRQFRKIQMI